MCSSPLFPAATTSINVDKSTSKRLSKKMTAMKATNKELKGMMKTVRIEDIDSMQDEMMDLMDVSNEIQETLGRSYIVPDDIDEEELMGDNSVCCSHSVCWKMKSLMLWKPIWTLNRIQSHYLQPDKETDHDSELNLPLHQVAMQQFRRTGSRRMNWDCLPCRTHQFVPE
ncbi:Charged multivesicular body protein 5 [Triticum urartu]|uniref:Charged multivesicular body protein 5 n=1 Tax=Triticum urartu TaxID=4572 RepID=M8A6V2_TRIUA|nr:Charged multivesicular body protein 5 [Triticum urartu]